MKIEFEGKSMIVRINELKKKKEKKVVPDIAEVYENWKGLIQLAAALVTSTPPPLLSELARVISATIPVAHGLLYRNCTPRLKTVKKW